MSFSSETIEYVNIQITVLLRRFYGDLIHIAEGAYIDNVHQ